MHRASALNGTFSMRQAKTYSRTTGTCCTTVAELLAMSSNMLCFRRTQESCTLALYGSAAKLPEILSSFA